MKSGVYCLTFKDGSQYVGKSIDMQRRWKEHADAMSSDRAAGKLQQAYNNNGFPSARILIECHSDHIDLMEDYYICKLQPVLNTVGGITISNKDIDTLGRRVDLLQQSTADHVNCIEAQEEVIASYKREIDKLNNDLKQAALDHYMHEKVSQLNNEAKNLREEGRQLYEEREVLEEEVLKYKTAGLLRRIFKKW